MNDQQNRLTLGRPTTYPSAYDPALLCPVPRRFKREEIGLVGELPFGGVDIWNAYELSWLNPSGKPIVAVGEFRFPCTSPNMIESKSLKLYLNSFNLTRFAGLDDVRALISQDLGAAAGAPVDVQLSDHQAFDTARIDTLPGICLDDLDVHDPTYELDPALLAEATEPGHLVEQTLHSHLLKSNCLVTHQPDWASIMIRYRGLQISSERLLRYLISFRQHNEFHEQCVERIFCDLQHFCQPECLSVYARYTRRGGLDINPFRSNFETEVKNLRLARQ